MTSAPRPAPFSVVIPAYNEEAVISRCLTAILVDAPRDAPPEIVVAANGCRDATAERARSFGVKVIEIEEGSKPRAINAGARAAQARPVIVVDADVVVGYRALAATAEALAQPGVRAAAPALRVDLHGCSWMVRSYYKVWRALPYVRDGLVGSGVYGLSAEGLEAVGEIPDIIADDAYVRARFAPSERRNVASDRSGWPTEFVIFPPRTARDLVRIEARRRAGDVQLREAPEGIRSRLRLVGSTTPASVAKGLFRWYGLQDLAVYLALKTAGRLRQRLERAAGRGGRWLRDESSRARVAH